MTQDLEQPPGGTAAEAGRRLRGIPLGGLGEIGANCLVLEQPVAGSSAALDLLVVDCGATFPSEDYGVDYLHPRFDHLAQRLTTEAARAQGHRLAGVVLTHGHEDHIGALGALARALLAAGLDRIDVWGAAHACALARLRLDDEGVPHADADDGGSERRGVILHQVVPGRAFDVGSYRVEMVRMAHSIPQTAALAIETIAGRVVHSGDFKIDPHPRDGEVTDEARLASLGEEGVDLLLSDSTNSLRAGHTGSEREAAFAIDRIVGQAPSRVVVGLFASNLHRVRAVTDACQRHGRHLLLLGRSVRKHVEVARQLGLVDWPSDLLVSPETAAGLAPHNLAVIASGTQAEPRGSLRRIASGSHPAFRVEAGDVVALSSRVIPGSERAVHRMIDDFIALGAEVRTSRTDPDIHVSGHAYRQEQERLVELLRPRCFVPIHGTRQHLASHAALAEDLGVDQIVSVVDGEAFALERDGEAITLRRDGAVPAGKVATMAGITLDEETLRERRQIGRSGVVTLIVTRAQDQPRLTICARGVPCYEQVVAEAERSAQRALDRGPSQADRLAEKVRRAVRRRLGELLGPRPTVDVMIVDIDPPGE